MDLHNNIDVRRVLSPVAAAVADDTAQVGEVVNHTGYEDAEYLIATGTLADAGATFTALLEEDDDVAMGTATAVADADLIGTEALASFTQAEDNKVLKLGYKGRKPFTRLTITPAGNAGAAPMAAICILSGARKGPSANPPA